MRQVRFAAAVLAAIVSFTANAGSMQRDVEWVRPRIGQRGTTVEVVIQGTHLSDPEELIFFKPGIRAVRVEPLPKMQHAQGLVHGGRMEEQVKAVLEIAADCEPGEHAFRLRTASTLSLLATFHVTPFPVVAATSEPNDTIATAQAVDTNVTVLGTVGTDVFKVPAEPGSRLSVEVDCVRLADVHYGDAEFDLALRVLYETGRVLATNDENALHVQDPLVSLRLPMISPVATPTLRCGSRSTSRELFPIAFTSARFAGRWRRIRPEGPLERPFRRRSWGIRLASSPRRLPCQTPPGRFHGLVTPRHRSRCGHQPSAMFSKTATLQRLACPRCPLRSTVSSTRRETPMRFGSL